MLFDAYNISTNSPTLITMYSIHNVKLLLQNVKVEEMEQEFDIVYAAAGAWTCCLLISWSWPKGLSWSRLDCTTYLQCSVVFDPTKDCTGYSTDSFSLLSSVRRLRSVLESSMVVFFIPAHTLFAEALPTGWVFPCCPMLGRGSCQWCLEYLRKDTCERSHLCR